MSDQGTRPELLLANVERGQCPYCEAALGAPSTNDYRPCLGCRRQWKIDIVHGRSCCGSSRGAACRLRSVASRQSAPALAPARRSRLAMTECDWTDRRAARRHVLLTMTTERRRRLALAPGSQCRWCAGESSS